MTKYILLLVFLFTIQYGNCASSGPSEDPVNPHFSISPEALAAYNHNNVIPATLARESNRTNITAKDIYGIVASEFVYKAAKDPAKFRIGTVLTADHFTALGMPSILVGWKIVHILDTIGESAGLTSMDGLASLFDRSNSDMYGVTLESPSSDSVAPYRISAIRGTDSKSIKNILVDLCLLKNDGDMNKTFAEMKSSLTATIQKRYPKTSILSAMFMTALSNSSLGLNPFETLLGDKLPENIEVYGPIAGASANFFIQGWIQKVINEVDEFIRLSTPNMVVGHSLGGILANSIVRAREAIGGSGADLAKSIDYIGSYNAPGTNLLIPSVIRILQGNDTVSTSVTPSTFVMPTDFCLVGKDMQRYREIYREIDFIGSLGKHIGTTVKIGMRITPAVLASMGLTALIPTSIAIDDSSGSTASGAGAGSATTAAETIIASEVAAFTAPLSSTTVPSAGSATYIGIAASRLSGVYTAVSGTVGSAFTSLSTYVGGHVDSAQAAIKSEAAEILADHSAHELLKHMLILYAHLNRPSAI